MMLAGGFGNYDGPVSLDAGGTVRIQGSSGNDVVQVGVWQYNHVYVNYHTPYDSRFDVFDLRLVKEIRFSGGDGNDMFDNRTQVPSKLWGDSGNDILAGGGAHDYIHGGEGDDVIYGRGGNDDLVGEKGDDRIYGSYGNDIIRGGFGEDRLYGQKGDDKIYGDAMRGSVEIKGVSVNWVTPFDRGGFGPTNTDYIYGGDGYDELWGEFGDDYLYGGNGGDVLVGQHGDDDLYGEGGFDWLFGNDGSDWLDGGNDGYARNILVGGAGADFYVQWMVIPAAGPAAPQYETNVGFNGSEGDRFAYMYSVGLL